MNPLTGLQTGWVPQTPNMTWQGGLMGPQPSQSPPSLMNTTPGDWSQVAYNMAGRPLQGPYPSVTPPPMPPGVTNGTQSAGGSSIGGTALGLLGALAKNPSLLKSAVNGISGLFGGSSIPASVAAEGGAAADAANTASSAYAANGISGISELPSVSAAVDAAPSGGLMGSVSPLIADDVAATTGITGAGLAPIGFDAVSELPSVSAAVDAAGSGSAAGAGGLGLAPAAGIAAILPVGLMLGDAWTGKSTQGNAAMKGWMQATGATFKPNYTNSGQNTFGTDNGLLNASSNPGTMYDKSGNAMTPKQAANAIYAWAVANHMNPGDFKPT